MERAEGVVYVTQLVKTNLLLALSDWDLDPTLGIDWFTILGTNYDLGIIQGIVAKSIRGTIGVDKLNSIEIDFDKPTRKATIKFFAESDGTTFTETITI